MFTYTGTHAGTDTVTATSGSASDTSTITWNKPPKSPTRLTFKRTPKGSIHKGHKETFFGKLIATDPAVCDVNGLRVKLYRNGRLVGIDKTGSAGGWKLVRRLFKKGTATWQAKFGGTGACRKSHSRTRTITVV